MISLLCAFLGNDRQDCYSGPVTPSSPLLTPIHRALRKVPHETLHVSRLRVSVLSDKMGPLVRFQSRLKSDADVAPVDKERVPYARGATYSCFSITFSQLTHP